MDYAKFKGFLVENKIKQIQLADEMGISREKLNKILNGKAEFTASELIWLALRFDFDVREFAL